MIEIGRAMAGMLARRIRALFLSAALVSLSGSLAAQHLIGTVPISQSSWNLATNSVTKKVYIGATYSDGLTVIDENSLSTIVLPVSQPSFLAVDEVRNKIYTVGFGGMTVIDGATNETTTVRVLGGPMAFNPVTNKVYVVNLFGGITVVDGSTLATTDIAFSQQISVPQVVVDTVTNKIFVPNTYPPDGIFVIDGITNATTFLPTEDIPEAAVADNFLNKVYVGASGLLDNRTKVIVVDGATLSTHTVDVGQGFGGPNWMAVNPRTHKVYFASIRVDVNNVGLAVLDGTTLATSSVDLVQHYPTSIAVEPVTDRVYIPYNNNVTGNGLLAVNGQSNSVSQVFSGGTPWRVAVDSVTDRIYVTDQQNGLAWVVAGPDALQFVPVTPCRVVDTRQPNGTFGGPPIQGGTYRSFPLTQGDCNIAANAAAYSLNVTVVPQGRLSYLTIWPDGEAQPTVSTMNSFDGRVKANAAIVPAGIASAVDVYASDTANVILDINGYFKRANNMALTFYSVEPCRVVDSRNANGPLGGPYLVGSQERDFPILTSDCGIPANAQAYSFNITALPHTRLDYLSVWPQGQTQPVVSTLNAPTGTVTANAAIVPAGTGGGVAVFPTNDTDLLIDINGYFASPGPQGMSLYTVTPCRILDTRSSRGAFSGTILIDVIDSGCGLQHAQAFVLNATVVPQGRLGYLNLWPTTEFQPTTSVLNAMDGAITSNMAIVTNIDGWLDAYASHPTQLILDGFSYFAP